MRTDFRDSPGFDDSDPVRMGDRAQAVSDHKTRSILHQLGQASQDESFAFRVEVTGRFVQNQDLRVGQHSSRDRHSLALSTAETHSPFTNQRVLAIGQAFDEFANVGNFSRVLNVLLRRMPTSVADVVGDGSVEKKNILFDDPEQPAEAFDLKL